MTRLKALSFPYVDKNITGIIVGEAVAEFGSSSANCSGYVETIAVGQSADTVGLGK